MDELVPYTSRSARVVDSTLPVSRSADISEIRERVLQFRRAALEIRNLVGPRCEEILAGKEIPDKNSEAWAVISEIRQLLPGLIDNVSIMERLIDVPENFASALERVGHSVSTSMMSSSPEVRRFRMISESLDLLREYLKMDYAGIWLIREGGDIAIHESGKLHEDAEFGVIREQVGLAIEGTRGGRFAYLDPSDSEDGGVDAVFVFRNIDDEAIGYLLLDDYDTAHDIDLDSISEIAKTYYSQLRTIIHEEEAALAKKELAGIQKELERMRSELHDNQYDKLTGLLHRDASQQVIEHAISRLRNAPAGTSAALCMVDIDFFKKVNDTYGHDKGDEVLAAVGGVLAGNGADYQPRGTDTASRWGGEEFVMFLDKTEERGAKSAMRRISSAIKNLSFPGNKPGEEFRITITAGIVVIRPTDVKSLDRDVELVPHFLKFADNCLYYGKQMFRDIVVVHEEGLDFPPKPVQPTLELLGREPWEAEMEAYAAETGEYESQLRILRGRTVQAFEATELFR